MSVGYHVSEVEEAFRAGQLHRAATYAFLLYQLLRIAAVDAERRPAGDAPLGMLRP